MNKTSSFIPMAEISLRNERIMLVGGMGFVGHHLALCLKEGRSRSFDR